MVGAGVTGTGVGPWLSIADVISVETSNTKSRPEQTKLTVTGFSTVQTPAMAGMDRCGSPGVRS